jgi:gamma-glutamylcyclotransferase (GGCT)/AIG2-like uncharacterized protein YtfP
MRSDALSRLATYGSLAPGKSNHHQLAALRGHWISGVVRGDLYQDGWGTLQGYPGLVLNPEGAPVTVAMFCSEDLPRHWARLDAFEGRDYRRVVTQVATADGPFDACIYVVASKP